MSDYAQRSADRQSKLSDEKSKVDAENERKYAEQQGKHDQALASKINVADKILNQEREKLNILKDGNAAKLAEIRSEMQNCINEKLKAHGAEGNEKVALAKAELEAQHLNLEHKEKLYKEQLTATCKILENGEKLRQEEHKKIKEEGAEKKKEMNKEFLELNAKLHETKMMGEEQLKQLDDKRNQKRLEQAEKEYDRGFGTVLNAYELQNSLAVEDGFRAFQQRCQSMIRKHSNFCVEYDSLEATLLKCDNRMKKNKTIEECEMEDLFVALRALSREVSELDAAGSTKEQEFTTIKGDLIELLTNLTTEFNHIKAATEDYEDEKDSQDGNDSGILPGILEAKKIMKDISGKIQSFNVIPRDHFRETLAIQINKVGAARASDHHAIQAAPTHSDTLAIGH